jgi:ribosomal protein L37AE/L43A
MSGLHGTLYSSKAQVKKLIEVFIQIHQCGECNRFYTEIENIGSWKCRYHPGKYDYDLRKWTCCGESYKHYYSEVASFDAHLTWSKKQTLQVPELTSNGCMRCDCVSIYNNLIPKQTIVVDDIASIIPYMQHYGSPLEDRPGLKTGKPLTIRRYEPRPKICWTVPPKE